jgi:hypothetical protein
MVRGVGVVGWEGKEEEVQHGDRMETWALRMCLLLGEGGVVVSLWSALGERGWVERWTHHIVKGGISVLLCCYVILYAVYPVKAERVVKVNCSRKSRSGESPSRAAFDGLVGLFFCGPLLWLEATHSLVIPVIQGRLGCQPGLTSGPSATSNFHSLYPFHNARDQPRLPPSPRSPIFDRAGNQSRENQG